MASPVNAIPLDDVPDDVVLGWPSTPRSMPEDRDPADAAGDGNSACSPAPARSRRTRAHRGLDRQPPRPGRPRRTTPNRNHLESAHRRLPALRRLPRRTGRRGGAETAFADWSRFRVAYRRGITVVRLIDQSLWSRRSQVRELTCDLID